MTLEKTTVMRILEAAGIAYAHFEYASGEATNGEEVARLLGKDPQTVFKTLVTLGKSGRHYVFMIPVAAELDLKRAALAAGEKSIEMIKSKELLPLTGYIHGGCSPIGMRKAFPTFIDETALLCDTITFSAGKIGLQVELPISDLQKVAPVTPVDLVQV
jgi:Cys-tRNA(Pro)/Cys-tRNA(Cys) deacylase